MDPLNKILLPEMGADTVVSAISVIGLTEKYEIETACSCKRFAASNFLQTGRFGVNCALAILGGPG
jgi:hypothetical protein